MRLIEFLEPTEALVEDTGSYVRIPLFHLGGSYQDYASYRSERLMESLTLNEAAIDRYAEMLNVFKTLDEWARTYTSLPDNSYNQGMEHLEWAMRTLKREDRIVWYMRLRKGMMLASLAMAPQSIDDENAKQEIFNFINKEYNKIKGKLTKSFGSSTEAEMAMNQIDNHTFATRIEHYLSMGIDKIDKTVWKDQTPTELLSHFQEIEREWIARRDSTINTGDDEDRELHERIIEFPDGMVWFDLNRSSCRYEADAMGHCGNAHVNESDETVLSLREPVDEGGRKIKDKDKHDGNHWRPRLTFILNTKTGMLGEMKGRANTAPKKELHPYIIALLRSDIVSGIVGGGYAPHENFSMDDLEPDVKESLIKEKPGLGTLMEHYQLEGFSDSVLDRFETTLDQYDVEHGGIADSEDGKTKELILTIHSNPIDFITDYARTSTAEAVAEYVIGGEPLDFYGGYNGDLEDRQEIAEQYFGDSTNKQEWERLQAYVLSEYPEEFGYEEDENGELQYVNDDADEDIENISDVVRVLNQENDDIYNELGTAISDGHRLGAENEMAEAFWNWITTPFKEHWCRLQLAEQKYDDQCEVRADLVEIFNELGPNEHFLEDISYNGWMEAIEFDDLDEPQYGWNGFDEEAALEFLSNHLEIPEVPSFEIETKGNALKSDVNKIKNRIELEFNGDWKKSSFHNEVLVSNEDVRFSGVEEMRGVVVMNVFTPPTAGGDSMPVKFSQVLRKLAEIANEVGVPIVIRNYSNRVLSDMVGEAGFKKIRHDYLRYDPTTNESARVKLRGFGKKDNQGDSEDFIEDLFDIAEPHPMNDRMVMLGPVGIHVSKQGNNAVHLHDIVTFDEAMSGKGTRALQVLTKLADKHGIEIHGMAKAYSNNSDHIQDTERLTQWYLKHGFELLDGECIDPDYGCEIVYKGNTSQVSEAPIDDYALIGNWGDKEKSNSFRNPQDRKIVQSDNLVKKVRKKFGNTDHMLNFYFVNLPGAGKFAESGLIDFSEVENMPPVLQKAWKLIQQRQDEKGTDSENAINVLYVGNDGFQRVPMTAWIMAHRLGHVLQSGAPHTGFRGNSYRPGAINSWNDLEREFQEMMSRIFEEVYSWKVPTRSPIGQSNARPFWDNPDVAKFFEAIGTMASARSGKLGGRPYEFLYELFAQYITTGQIQFKELPRTFGRRGSKHTVRDEELYEMYNRDLGAGSPGWFTDHLEAYMDNCLHEATGKYLVM